MPSLEAAVIVGGAALLGAVHALESDHLAAVGAFVARRPDRRQAARFGLRWATGHGVSLLAFGTVLYLLSRAVPESASRWMERAVGFAVFFAGVLALARLWRRRAESGEPVRGLFRMGLLHGLAGTAAFAAQAVVAWSKGYTAVLSYALSFSLGVAVSMALYAFVLAAAVSGRQARGSGFGFAARVCLALWACGVGFARAIS